MNIFNARMSKRTLSKNSIYDIFIMIIIKYNYIYINIIYIINSQLIIYVHMKQPCYIHNCANPDFQGSLEPKQFLCCLLVIINSCKKIQPNRISGSMFSIYTPLFLLNCKRKPGDIYSYNLVMCVIVSSSSSL